MGFSEVNNPNDDETFGIMFQLGDMGTFIVPIDLKHEYYENATRDMSRIKNKEYSDSVNLVNYSVDENNEKNIFIDNLATIDSDVFGQPDSSELFYSSMEDPMLFNKVTRDLLEQYHSYTH